jgi:hypothetical protein
MSANPAASADPTASTSPADPDEPFRKAHEAVESCMAPDQYRLPTQFYISPDAANRLGASDSAAYRTHLDKSCDLTMRGGTTSGVIYPLAECTLARPYVFRSVGSAYAGAIAASATTAAKLQPRLATVDAMSAADRPSAIRTVVRTGTGRTRPDVAVPEP